MRIYDWKSVAANAVAICCLLIGLSPAAATSQVQTAVAAQEAVITLDPAQTKLHWTVDSTLHLVHGTFVVKSGAIHFAPETGKAGGEIVVLAASGDSENSSRDAKMHKDVLESAKYPEAVFRATQVEGKVAGAGGSDVKLHGILVLHGGEHELVVPVHVEITKGAWKGTAKFTVPYIQWGLKDPSNFLLKVRPVVDVELEMAGTDSMNPPNLAADRQASPN